MEVRKSYCFLISRSLSGRRSNIDVDKGRDTSEKIDRSKRIEIVTMDIVRFFHIADKRECIMYYFFKLLRERTPFARG